MKLSARTALLAAALLLVQPAFARPVPSDGTLGAGPDGLLMDRERGGSEAVAEQTPSAPETGTQPVPMPSPASTPVAPQSPAAEPSPADSPPAEDNADEGGEDFSMGDIPVVETVELTVDQAKRALDTYVLVSEKYKDAELEIYENLQDFVDQAPQGKAFEADIKAAGFATVNDWNTAITTLSFALANLSDDQTADIRQQIEEIKADTEMAQDMRDRMIAALSAMIPSENNKKVIAELMKDPVYGEKLKQLETEEVE